MASGIPADGTGASAQGGDVVRRPTIGLALGGGGARGLAHILALEAFDELGLKPAVMAGTSIGAVFAAAYASGYSAAQIRAHTEEVLKSRVDILRQAFSARQQPLQKMLSVLSLRSALVNAEALVDLVMPTRVARDFAELQIPLHIVAADFHDQGQVVLSHGALRKAVAASMALPVIFAPVTNDDRTLLDGGLVNPLPFDLIDGAADIIVAVNVSGAGRLADDRSTPSALETVVSSLHILQRTIVEEKLRSRRPDILIEVDVGRFHVLEFHKLRDVLEAAAPAKALLKHRLQRVLGAETLDHHSLPASAAPDKLSAPGGVTGRGFVEPHRQGGKGTATQRRLADRLLGKP
ncbi:MAG: patatin-like phospholipase family protein [Hyphomicrobiaceae bacterium]|nr:patatin-like phospholipase family protein [Hyphomicrobiaceae bacterium]